MTTWAEKYRPIYFEDIRGQEEAVAKIKDFIKNFPLKKRAIILYGPTGTGKTVLAHAVSKEIISEIIELKNLDYKIIKDVLIKILRKEKKFIDNKIITEIAVKAKGDLRAAINDVQTISKLSSEEQIKTLFDERNKEENSLDALKKVFKLKATNETLRAFDQLDIKTDEIILWVEKNIPLEYRDEKLEKAYELLSETDIFKGRIY